MYIPKYCTLHEKNNRAGERVDVQRGAQVRLWGAERGINKVAKPEFIEQVR